MYTCLCVSDNDTLYLFSRIAGILSLLKESEDEIKAFALKRLDQLVDVFWAEIAESISAM